MRMRWWWLAVSLLVLAGVFAAFTWRSRPLAVKIVRAQQGTAVELVYATGYVEPHQPVGVAARLTAPVDAVLVQEGDRVRKGQALLTLDDSDLRAAYGQTRALSIGAGLAEARATTLFEKGWVTRSDRDAAVANGEAARAAERAALAKLRQNVVRAGIDGVVIKRDIEPGELAVPTRTLMTLGDPNRIRVTATVDERDIPKIRVGQKALLSSEAWPGRLIPAHVAELTPAGGPDQRAFRARLSLDDPAPMPLGMSVEVNIVTREKRGVVLAPNSAISESAVWVIRNSRAHRVPVVPGIRGQDRTEVRGISPDALLIDKPGEIEEGRRVSVGA